MGAMLAITTALLRQAVNPAIMVTAQLALPADLTALLVGLDIAEVSSAHMEELPPAHIVADTADTVN